MKKLNAMIVGLALLAGLQSIRSQIPSLSITQVGGQSLLYWPFSETSPLSLESTTSLQSGLWTPEANAVRVDAYIVTNTSPTKFFRLIPSWQVAIPSGMFTMGNTLTNDTDLDDAIPTNVYVSKFYMDKNLVALAQWQPVFDWATNHGYRFEDWAYDGYNWLTNHGSGVTGV